MDAVWSSVGRSCLIISLLTTVLTGSLVALQGGPSTEVLLRQLSNSSGSTIPHGKASASTSPAVTLPSDQPIKTFNCECFDLGDGDACSYPLTPMQVTRLPGAGPNKCQQTTFRAPYKNEGIVRNTSWPYYTCDTAREIADHVWDTPEYGCPVEPETVKCGDIIFTPSGPWLWEQRLKAGIKHPFILVSCGSDLPIPHPHTGEYLASYPTLWAWYGVNVVDRTPYTRFLPIGVEGQGWATGNVSRMLASWPTDSEAVREGMRSKLTRFLNGSWPAEKRVLFAFSTHTNPGERESAERAAQALGLPRVTVAPEQWPEELTQYMFVLAPMGNGFDSHRQWEALNAMSIPIMRLEQQYHMSCLPATYVREWSDLTWAHLQLSAQELLAQLDSFDFRRLFADYHIARLRREQARARKWCAEEDVRRNVTAT